MCQRCWTLEAKLLTSLNTSFLLHHSRTAPLFASSSAQVDTPRGLGRSEWAPWDDGPNLNSSGLGLEPPIVNGWTLTGWADEIHVFVQKFAANIQVFFSINLCSPDLDYLSLKQAFPTDIGKGFSSLWPFFPNKYKWPSCPSPGGWGSAVCLNLPVNATLTCSGHK